MGTLEYYPNSAHQQRQEGGLYKHGNNSIPTAHYQRLVEASNLIVPRDPNGNPDPVNGKIGVISVGMSNTQMEFDTFMTNANLDPEKSDKVVLINASQGSRDASFWAGRSTSNPWPWDYFDEKIQEAGLTPAQVQVAWVKHANANPNQPGSDDFPIYAEDLYRDMTFIANYLLAHQNHTTGSTTTTNIKVAYLSSRIYGGYSLGPLNPEPSAYESAFSMRWLIFDQQGLHQPNLSLNTTVPYTEVDYNNAPILAWGPYLWANGIIERNEPLLGPGENLPGE
jgi:hypothetical protein